MRIVFYAAVSLIFLGAIGSIYPHYHLNVPEPAPPVLGACGEFCEKVDFLNMTPRERLSLWRTGLIKQFGEIPEVDLYIDYMKLRHGTGSVSEEKALDYVRAVATLFPNEANLNHLREMELRVEKSH